MKIEHITLQPKSSDPNFKSCSECWEIKNLKEFGRYQPWEGRLYFRSTCKACDAQRSRIYDSQYPEKAVERGVRRRNTKHKATPLWLSKSDKKDIGKIYKECRARNKEAGYIKYHVDHIIPLQGTDVCGLHVPWNLQIITARENLAKSNKPINGGRK